MSETEIMVPEPLFGVWVGETGCIARCDAVLRQLEVVASKDGLVVVVERRDGVDAWALRLPPAIARNFAAQILAAADEADAA